MQNLKNSFKKFVESEIMEDDNAYFCEECNKKIRARKTVSIDRPPNILIVALKRFEFDSKTYWKRKLNDYFEFPNEFNLYDFTSDKIYQK